MKKYVLTGGPGSGKTAIIIALERLGEYVIREAAEDYIRFKQAMGIAKPWLEKDFQEKILEIQLRREAKIPKEVKRVFLDRGILDGLAYVKEKSKIAKRIIKESKKIRYEKVFLIEDLGKFEKNKIRRENVNKAKEIGKKLEAIYENFGYKLIKIENTELKERVNKILKHL